MSREETLKELLERNEWLKKKYNVKSNIKPKKKLSPIKTKTKRKKPKTTLPSGIRNLQQYKEFKKVMEWD